MIRRPPRSTRTDTLFPYTTLFRSVADGGSNSVETLDIARPLRLCHWSNKRRFLWPMPSVPASAQARSHYEGVAVTAGRNPAFPCCVSRPPVVGLVNRKITIGAARISHVEHDPRRVFTQRHCAVQRGVSAQEVYVPRGKVVGIHGISTEILVNARLFLVPRGVWHAL